MLLIWIQMVLAKEQSDSFVQSGAIESNSQLKSITEGPEPMKFIQNNENGQAKESFVAEVCIFSFLALMLYCFGCNKPALILHHQIRINSQ